jgi:hypothetical protein
MELNLANIKNIKDICRVPQAVQISQQDEENYEKLCHQNIPIGTNQTCGN